METSRWEEKDLQARDTARRVSITVEYSCAQCGHCLSYDEKENFCPKCGQRVYWPDMNKSTLVKAEDGLEIHTLDGDTI